MQQSIAAKPGLSVFLPAYNDSGTIASLVISAIQTARKHLRPAVGVESAVAIADRGDRA